MAKGKCSAPPSLLSALGQMAGASSLHPLGLRLFWLQAGRLSASKKCRATRGSRLAQEAPISCRSLEHSEDKFERSGQIAVEPVCRPGAVIGIAVGGRLMI